LLLVLYALSFGRVVMVTPLTATLPLWVVIGSKLFLRDVEKITTRTGHRRDSRGRRHHRHIAGRELSGNSPKQILVV